MRMVVSCGKHYEQEVEATDFLEAALNAFMIKLPLVIGEVIAVRELTPSGKRLTARYMLSVNVIMEIGLASTYKKKKRYFVLNTSSEQIEEVK